MRGNGEAEAATKQPSGFSSPPDLERATADYFATRDDARVIEAGSGLFNRKAAKLEEAKVRREETARAWKVWEFELPGSPSNDEAVPMAPTGPPSGSLPPHFARRRSRPGGAGRADLEKRIATRDNARERAIDANKSRARARQDLVAAADELWAEVAHSRQVRAELAERMTPEEVAGADQARDALLNARHRQLARRQAHQAERDFGPRIDRCGPGLGF